MNNKLKKIIICIMFLCMIFSLCLGCSMDSNKKDIKESKENNNTKENINTDKNEEDTIIKEDKEDKEDKKEKEIDYSCYNELIDAVTKGLQNGFSEEQQMNLDISSCFFYGEGESYETLGYIKRDLDNNGIEELIFGENSNSDDWDDGIVYDVYTIDENGEIQHVLDGWERNRYYLCDDGIIANEGSGGAFCSTWCYYNYVDLKLKFVEGVYYDEFKNKENPWFYSNKSENFEDEKNIENISEKNGNSVINAYKTKYEKIKFTPFVKK